MQAAQKAERWAGWTAGCSVHWRAANSVVHWVERKAGRMARLLVGKMVASWAAQLADNSDASMAECLDVQKVHQRAVRKVSWTVGLSAAMKETQQVDWKAEMTAAWWAVLWAAKKVAHSVVPLAEPVAANLAVMLAVTTAAKWAIRLVELSAAWLAAHLAVLKGRMPAVSSVGCSAVCWVALKGATRAAEMADQLVKKTVVLWDIQRAEQTAALSVAS